MVEWKGLKESFSSSGFGWEDNFLDNKNIKLTRKLKWEVVLVTGVGGLLGSRFSKWLIENKEM